MPPLNQQANAVDGVSINESLMNYIYRINGSAATFMTPNIVEPSRHSLVFQLAIFSCIKKETFRSLL